MNLPNQKKKNKKKKRNGLNWLIQTNVKNYKYLDLFFINSEIIILQEIL